MTRLGSVQNPQPRQFTPSRILEAGQAFMRIEASSGIALVLAAIVALIWINSPWGSSYTDLWHSEVVIRTGLFAIEEDLAHFVNDGLMTLFFFLVGLEIKRELVHGELSHPRRALLPATAALGGMVLPALIYTAFNGGGEGSRGWGIPMATDIAFAVGVLSLVGRRAPFSVKVFLLALAVADDIGAIGVIAVFYTQTIDLQALLLAGIIFSVIVLMNRAGIRAIEIYVLAGACLWLAVLESGIHATISGVVLGLLAPARYFYPPASFAPSAQDLVDRFRAALERGDVEEQHVLLARMEDLSQGTEAVLDRLERHLHPWVAFVIVPLFALANSGVEVSGDMVNAAIDSPVSQGVAFGLLLGKPLGILTFTWLAVRFRLCEMPRGANWAHILGIGMLGGIGFTVSLLVTNLSFQTALLTDEAKLGILAASVASGLLGYVFLQLVHRLSAPGRSP